MPMGKEGTLVMMHGSRRGDHWPWCMVLGEVNFDHGTWSKSNGPRRGETLVVS